MTRQPLDRSGCDAGEALPTQGLLANMSARPRTEISRTIPPTRKEWLRFGPLRPGRLTREERAALDAVWERLGFTGAFLLLPAEKLDVSAVELRACLDPLLEKNVLLRSRGALLLAAMPLVDDTHDFTTTSLVCDDPRLLEAC